MRLIHTSDLHVTNNAHLPDQIEVLGKILREGLERRPDVWLITGDLYGREVPHRSTPAEREAVSAVISAAAADAPVVICAGNHDHTVDLQGLRHLGSRWPVHVITTPTAQTIMTPSGPLHLYGLPYPTRRLLAGEDEQPQGVLQTRAAIELKLGALLQLWQRRVQRCRAEDPEIPHVLAGHVMVHGATTGAGVVLAGHEPEISADQLSDLGADYVGLGHLHARQQVAERCWYVGSPWHTAHAVGELPIRAWHVVDIGHDHAGRTVPGGDYAAGDLRVRAYPQGTGAGAQLEVWVDPQSTSCRPWLTLDYEWGMVEGADRPGWITRPRLTYEANGEMWPNCTHALIKLGAHVRARLTVSARHATSCPWDTEIEALRDLGAHLLTAERTIVPVARVRAPEVIRAQTLPDKLRAYWAAQEDTPTEPEIEAALGALDELQASA